VKTDQDKSKILKRFEKENDAFYDMHKKELKQVAVNQWAFRGFIGEEDEEGNRDQVQTNIIRSFVLSYLPHVFAKSPTVSITAQEKVNPVDGDSKQDEVYASINRFSDTARILVQHSFNRAKLKRGMKKAVKAKIIECGSVVKVSYLKDRREDPTITKDIRSAQHQQAKLQAMRNGIEEGSDNFDALVKAVNDGTYKPSMEGADEYEQYKDTLKALEANQNPVASQGLDVSVIPVSQMRWDKSKSMDEMCDGKFISHYVYETVLDAKAKYGIEEKEDDPDCRVLSWKKFNGVSDESKGKGKITLSTTGKDDKKHIRVWERWDTVTQCVYTWIEGDKEYAKPPQSVKPMQEMFYPFFPLAEIDDGTNKLPASNVELMIPIQKQYDKDSADKYAHREAAIPFTLFDAGLLDAKDLKPKVEKAGVRDFVGIDASGLNLNNLFSQGPSVNLDPRLYDRNDLLFDMQQTTGLQDAERGAVTKAKTLGEAQLLEQGLANRTEEARDQLEDMLKDLFKYGLLLLIENMPIDEVKRICGDHAYWPEVAESAESLFSLIDVSIEAGSSGRPNKAAEQKVWFENMEFLMGLVGQIDAKRASGIEDADNPFYHILEETFRRLDERLDIATIIPKTKVITTTELLQSIEQQVGQMVEQDPSIAPMAQQAQQMLMQNPVIQKIQEQQQQSQPQQQQ
jgi:hypothetical protein